MSIDDSTAATLAALRALTGHYPPASSVPSYADDYRFSESLYSNGR